MATKTISLDEDAYNKLKAQKEKGESFSDVVKKLADRRSLLEIAGIWEDDTENLREIIEESREKSRERQEKIAERMRDS